MGEADECIDDKQNLNQLLKQLSDLTPPVVVSLHGSSMYSRTDEN